MKWELYDGVSKGGPFNEADIIRAILVNGLHEASQVRPVGAKQWKGLRAHAPFAMALDERARIANVPRPMQVPMFQPATMSAPVATTTTMVSSTGAGCILQLLGATILLPSIVAFGTLFLTRDGGWLGMLLGGPGTLVGALILGWARSVNTTRKCSACGNPLADGSQMCPSCRATIVRG